MQQRKEVKCMIEIKISKEDDSDMVRVEADGIGDAYDGMVPGLLLQAAADYMQDKAGMSKLDALLNIFTGMSGFLKLIGVKEKFLQELVEKPPQSMPDASARH